MRKLLSILGGSILLIISSPLIFAQGGGGGITVVGSITPGHCGEFASATSIEDAGGACGGSGSSPGGSPNSFQFNSSGVFGGTTLTDISYSGHTITIGS